MRAMVSIAALGLLVLPAVPAQAQAPAQPLPQWAYPVAPPPKPPDAVKPIQLPAAPSHTPRRRSTTGSVRPTGTPKITADADVVAHGKPPGGFACDLCHLTSGGGHPESAGVSGLPVGYILRQMAEFKAGVRKGMRGGVMIQIAKVFPTRTPRRPRNISPR